MARWLLLRVAVLALVSTARTQHNDASSAHGIDLLRLIGDPTPKSVSVVAGQDDRSAFYFHRGAEVAKRFQGFFTKPLPADFSILVTITPATSQGGFIFSVMDALKQTVYLGVSVSPERQELQLHLTSSQERRTTPVATFRLPAPAKQLTRFALRIRGTEASLLDCEAEASEQKATLERPPGELRFPQGGGFFFVRGRNEQPRYEGVINDLRISTEPSAARQHCEDDDVLEVSAPTVAPTMTLNDGPKGGPRRRPRDAPPGQLSLGTRGGGRSAR